jgi:hypothetical protein
MSPILGIMASQGAIARGTSFESIQTVTVGSGGQANIEFTSIPATYKHLQLRGIGRSTNGDIGGDSVSVSFNGNTTYRSHYLFGEGAGGGQAGTDTIRNYITRVPGPGSLANTYSAFVCDILDYANTNKFKTGRSLFGFDVNGSGGSVYLSSFLYQSTTAVSSLTLTIYGGYTFAQYTQVALYGIKGA